MKKLEQKRGGAIETVRNGLGLVGAIPYALVDPFIPERLEISEDTRKNFKQVLGAGVIGGVFLL